MTCKICNKKTNWLHELACREHNTVAWFLLDYVRAMLFNDNEARIRAIEAYRNGFATKENS